jgi:hypothetical protein
MPAAEPTKRIRTSTSRSFVNTAILCVRTDIAAIPMMTSRQMALVNQTNTDVKVEDLYTFNQIIDVTTASMNGIDKPTAQVTPSALLCTTKPDRRYAANEKNIIIAVFANNAMNECPGTGKMGILYSTNVDKIKTTNAMFSRIITVPVNRLKGYITIHDRAKKSRPIKTAQGARGVSNVKNGKVLGVSRNITSETSIKLTETPVSMEAMITACQEKSSDVFVLSSDTFISSSVNFTARYNYKFDLYHDYQP